MPHRRFVQSERAERDRFHEAAIGALAHDAVMREREQLAVLVGGEPDSLMRIGTAVNVVEQLRARHRDLDRATDLLRGNRGQHRLRPEHLRPEPAADIGRQDAHLVRRNADRLGEHGLCDGENLQTRMQRELVAGPHRDRGMRFHRSMHLVGGGIDLVDRHPARCGRRRHRRIDIALGNVLQA